MARKAVVTSVEDRLAAALVPAEEQPYPVPENWCWVYSPVIFDIEYGKGLSIKQLTDTGYPVFGANGQIGYYSEYMFIHPQALMSCRGAYSGKMCISLPMSFVTSNSLVIQCKPAQIDSTFIRYLFESQDTSRLVTGSAQPQVTVQAFDSFPIPFIPLAEQHRIVDRIESLFTQLDETAEAAQAVIDGYEDRRAAILHKAFTGELTEEWRTTFGLSMETWHSYQYAELGTSKLGKMLDEKKNVGSFIPYLRNVNVRWFSFDLDDLLQMKASEEEIAKLSVEDGDLFICEGGEPGRCAVWENGKCELIFQKAIHRFRPNGIAETHFLAYYIFFYTLNGTLQQYFTGTTIKHLTGQSLAKIDFIIPSIAEQHEIVRRLDSLLSSESATKAAAEATLEQITTLRQSILARAFRGELGTGDPTDEPAIELLRRTIQTA